MVASLHCVLPILYLYLCRGAPLPNRHQFVLHISFLCMLSLKVVYSFLGREVHATIVKAVARVLLNRAQLCEWMGLVWLLGALIPDVSVGELKVTLLSTDCVPLEVCQGHCGQHLRSHPLTFEFLSVVFYFVGFQGKLLPCNPKLASNLLRSTGSPQTLSPPASSSKTVGMQACNNVFELLLAHRECLVSIFYLIYLLASSWGVYCLDLGEGCAIFISQVYNCGS